MSASPLACCSAVLSSSSFVKSATKSLVNGKSSPKEHSLRYIFSLSPVSAFSLPKNPFADSRRCMASSAMASSDTSTSLNESFSPPLEVLAKGATGNPEKLGDCPFTHRVLLTLEEKFIPYKLTLVDTANKPQWFLEANPEGKVPVVKRGEKWIPDSDVITALLEESFPEPTLKTPEEKATVGSKVFGAFVKFLKSPASVGSGSEEEINLRSELGELEKDLSNSGGAYICGETVHSVDLALAPKLYHLKIALSHFKKWDVLEEKDYEHVNSYLEAMQQRESFQKTAAPQDIVIAGWTRSLGV